MPEEIDNLLPLGDLPAGACVLDLGCGSGTVAYSRFPHLKFFGADQYAHTQSVDWPSNAWLVMADASRLPWPDGAFHTAICNFVFEHFADPRSALRELDRVVQPGGFLFASIPRASGLEDRLYRFTTKGGGHVQRYSFDTFMGLVYQESRFKLEGMGPVPGAFTWLRGMPFEGAIRSLLYRSARAWLRASGKNPLAASNFLMLFRLGERRGFKSIVQVCSHCGNCQSEAPVRLGNRWTCPACSLDNPLVET